MAKAADPSTAQTLFPGSPACPGVVCGPAFLSFAGLAESGGRLLEDEEVAAELGRLDSVARAARVGLVRQRESLGGQFTPEQRAVFDTHLRLLEDPVIEADVKERISDQRMTLEDAVKDVFHVYERLFEVVETESLRNKMSDMRDVALRYLRHCRRGGAGSGNSAPDMRGGILVVRELTLAELTEAMERGVGGLVAESGSPSSHGAILTRAVGIPAVIGVGQIRDRLVEGRLLLVDAHAGQVTVEPRREAIAAAENRALEADTAPIEEPKLEDGTPLPLLAAVASATEAKTAARLGVQRIGLYRTELPVIQRRGEPKEDSLVGLYRQVFAATKEVTFRLPDLDASCDLPDLFPVKEVNPALGLRGVRFLFSRPSLLEVHLRAMLRSAEDSPARIAVPFVLGPQELKRVREAATRVREELRLAGHQVPFAPKIGAVVETPAAALWGRELATEADFLLISLDSLAQNLLVAHRGPMQEEVPDATGSLHPVVLRAVGKLTRLADALDVELVAFGEALLAGNNAALLVGAGLRAFCLRPSLLEEARGRLHGLDLVSCKNAALELMATT